MEENDSMKYRVVFLIPESEKPKVFKCNTPQELLKIFWENHKKFDCVIIFVKNEVDHSFENAVDAYDYIVSLM